MELEGRATVGDLSSAPLTILLIPSQELWLLFVRSNVPDRKGVADQGLVQESKSQERPLSSQTDRVMGV